MLRDGEVTDETRRRIEHVIWISRKQASLNREYRATPL